MLQKLTWVMAMKVMLLYNNVDGIYKEAATTGVLWKKVFLEISQNSQEKTCARASFLNKVAGLRLATSFKKKDPDTGVSKSTFFT